MYQHATVLQMNCCVAKCFCTLEVVPPFDEMETLQVLQVTVLTFRVKYPNFRALLPQWHVYCALNQINAARV